MVPLLLVDKDTFWPGFVDAEGPDPLSQAVKRIMNAQTNVKI
jgi:hypothetical protein